MDAFCTEVKKYEPEISAVFVPVKIEAGFSSSVHVMEYYCETVAECWDVIKANRLDNGRWRPLEVNELPPEWKRHRDRILADMRFKKGVRRFRDAEPDKYQQLYDAIIMKPVSE